MVARRSSNSDRVTGSDGLGEESEDERDEDMAVTLGRKRTREVKWSFGIERGLEQYQT